MDGAPNGSLAFIVTDSRGNNFDVERLFSPPEDFKVVYCIARGAKVNDLKEIFLKKLDKFDVSGYFPIIVKIAVGINEFTTFVYNSRKEKELKYSGIKGLDVFSKLLDFKAAIKVKVPSALVGFITVPPVSLKKYKEHCLEHKYLTISEISNADLEKYQKDLENEIELLNKNIVFENCESQSGHFKGCRTVSWHRSVCRLGKKKRGKKYKKVYKTDFRELYDGIHGTSDVKQKWFKQLILAIRAEISYTKAETFPESDVATGSVYSGDNSQSEDSDKEDSWDFKRGQAESN